MHMRYKKTKLGELRSMEKLQLINEIKDIEQEVISMHIQIRRLKLAINRLKSRHLNPEVITK